MGRERCKVHRCRIHKNVSNDKEERIELIEEGEKMEA
jgi:hypothetical protein